MTPAKRNAGIILLAACGCAFVFWRDSRTKGQDAAIAPTETMQLKLNAVADTRIPPDPPPPPNWNTASADTSPNPNAAPAGAGFGGGSKRRRMYSYSVETSHADTSGKTGSSSGAAGTGQEGRAAGPTSVAWAGTQIAGHKAGPAIDQTLTLMPGLYSCTLDVAISSERPGPFFCHTKQDIKSPLNVTLMKAGTRIRGETRSDVGTGQSRIMSLSAIAWTPEGIPVPLGAPFGDEQGRIGMSGSLDTHLWSRIGGAVILMLTQGAFQAATAALQSSLSSGSGNTFFNLNSGGIESAVAGAVRNGSAIQNTVTLNQGAEVTFFVTEPISFADALTLSPTGGR